MSTSIIALAITMCLGVLSAAAADTTTAIVNRDLAATQARAVANTVIESCSSRRGCEVPPHCTTPACNICLVGSVVQATTEMDFDTALLKGLAPARATYLSDLSLVESSSLRGLKACSG